MYNPQVLCSQPNCPLLTLHYSVHYLTPHKCNVLSTGQVTTSLEFRTNLMRGLLENYGITRSCPPKGGCLALDTPLRLTGRHFPAEVPQTSVQGSSTRRHCKVCLSSSRKRKETRLTKYMSVPCNTPLCATPCFEEYHTLKKYRKKQQHTNQYKLYNSQKQMLTFDGVWHFGEVFSSRMNPGFHCTGQMADRVYGVVWVSSLLMSTLWIEWPMVAVGFWYGQAYVMDNKHRCILLMAL